jgi:hypothetical protein
MTAVGLGGKVLPSMGEEGQNFGVFAQFPQIGQTLPLTPPWRLETKPRVPKPSQIPTPITRSNQGIRQAAEKRREGRRAENG